MNVQNETLWMLGSRYKKQGRVWRDPSIEPSAAVCRFMFLESLAVRPSMVTVCSVQVVTTSSTYPTHPTDSYRFTASGLVRIEHGSQHALLSPTRQDPAGCVYSAALPHVGTYTPKWHGCSRLSVFPWISGCGR